MNESEQCTKRHNEIRKAKFMNWILRFICRAFRQPEIIGRNEAVRRLLAKGAR